MTWAIGGRKPRFNPEQAADLRAWAAQRKTLKQKAAELNCSPETLRRYIAGTRFKRKELRA